MGGLELLCSEASNRRDLGTEEQIEVPASASRGSEKSALKL